MTDKEIVNLAKRGAIFYLRGYQCIVTTFNIWQQGASFKVRYIDNSVAMTLALRRDGISYYAMPSGNFGYQEITEWVTASELMYYEPNDILMEIL